MKIIFLTIDDNRNISSSLLHCSPSRKPNPMMGGWQQRRRSSRRDYNSRPLRLPPPALLILLLQSPSSSLLLVKMAFTFAAFAYILALIIDAFLIFFAIFHVSHVSVPINEQSKCFLWMIMKFFFIELQQITPTQYKCNCQPHATTQSWNTNCFWRFENLSIACC